MANRVSASPCIPRCRPLTFPQIGFLRAVFFASISVFVLYIVVSVTLPFNSQFEDHCPAWPTYESDAPDPNRPNALPYTGLIAFDRTLCNFVTFFHVSFTSPGGWTFTTNLLASIPAPFFILYLEAARIGRPSSLAFPTAFALLAQSLTAAAALPVFWILLLSSKSTGGISSSSAAALAAAFIVGYGLPTLAIIADYENRSLLALWQIFPVFISVAQRIFASAFCPSRAESSPASLRSGYLITQLALSSMAFVAIAFHLHTLFSSTHSALDTFRDIYIPAYPDYPHTHSLLSEAIRLILTWDGLFAWSSTLLAGLWAFSVEEIVKSCVVLPLAILALGPGGTVTVVWIWREKKLHSAIPTKPVPRRV